MGSGFEITKQQLDADFDVIISTRNFDKVIILSKEIDVLSYGLFYCLKMVQMVFFEMAKVWIAK